MFSFCQQCHIVSKSGISINFLISNVKSLLALANSYYFLFFFFFSFPFKNSGCVVLSKGPIEVSCEDWMKNRKVSHTQFKRK